MHLVVLDDDEAIAGFVAAAASQRGWTAQAATDEAAFQALVRAAPPDAIMLDLQLGVSDGIEQLRFLHRQGYAGAIVLMSGFDPRVLASARQIGDSLGLMVAAVIEKPARAAQIRDVLTAIEYSMVAARPPAADANAGWPAPAGANIAVSDIANAIDRGEMVLHLQPIVSAFGHEVEQAEALVHWRHPVLGVLSADRFVPNAEQEKAVIDQLTMWVAETGVEQYLRLDALGSPLPIGINISGRSLYSVDFPDRMAQLIDRMSVPSGAIGLEITEGVAMHDPDAGSVALARLRLKGFPVAIDDFGTGHSSLAALRRMPFSAIKIDQSVIADLRTSSDALTIVRSVIRLARDMRLISVAEGVTSAEVARLLAELGIDLLQGQHFSEPLPFDGFLDWLAAWSRRPVAAYM